MTPNQTKLVAAWLTSFNEKKIVSGWTVKGIFSAVSDFKKNEHSWRDAIMYLLKRC